MELMTNTAPFGLTFLREYHQERPLDLEDDRFVMLHERLLRELSKIDSLADHLNDAERANYRSLCSRCHKRYLAIKEVQANKNLLASASNAGSSKGENLGSHGRNASPLLVTTQLETFRRWRNSNSGSQ